jgi:hypothetical protein
MADAAQLQAVGEALFDGSATAPRKPHLIAHAVHPDSILRSIVLVQQDSLVDNF